MTREWFDDYRTALLALIAGMSPFERDSYDADARWIANDLAEKRKELEQQHGFTPSDKYMAMLAQATLSDTKPLPTPEEVARDGLSRFTDMGRNGKRYSRVDESIAEVIREDRERRGV